MIVVALVALVAYGLGRSSASSWLDAFGAADEGAAAARSFERKAVKRTRAAFGIAKAHSETHALALWDDDDDDDDTELGASTPDLDVDAAGTTPVCTAAAVVRVAVASERACAPPGGDDGLGPSTGHEARSDRPPRA